MKAGSLMWSVTKYLYNQGWIEEGTTGDVEVRHRARHSTLASGHCIVQLRLACCMLLQAVRLGATCMHKPQSFRVVPDDQPCPEKLVNLGLAFISHLR